MSENILKVGDFVRIPFPDGRLYNGEVLDINNYSIDPRMKYKVAFDDLNIIMFYSEKMMKKILSR